MTFTPFKGEQAFQSHPPKGNSEMPPDDKLAKEWYKDTSWEGRNAREFEELRREVRIALSLDFDRYFHDKDYQRLIHENPRMQELIFEEEAVSLMALWDKRDQIGISSGQFEKLASTFNPGALERFRRNVAAEEILQSGYAAMSPEEAKEVDAAITHRIERTIEKQKMKDGDQL